MPDSLEVLDLLLLTVSTPRKVQRDGIHLHGLRYFAITLAPYVGEPVTIRYDPRDLAEIRVYHDDEFLCRSCFLVKPLSQLARGEKDLCRDCE